MRRRKYPPSTDWLAALLEMFHEGLIDAHDYELLWWAAP